MYIANLIINLCWKPFKPYCSSKVLHLLKSSDELMIESWTDLTLISLKMQLLYELANFCKIDFEYNIYIGWHNNGNIWMFLEIEFLLQVVIEKAFVLNINEYWWIFWFKLRLTWNWVYYQWLFPIV
jgi:hypothetical protein